MLHILGLSVSALPKCSYLTQKILLSCLLMFMGATHTSHLLFFQTPPSLSSYKIHFRFSLIFFQLQKIFISHLVTITHGDHFLSSQMNKIHLECSPIFYAPSNEIAWCMIRAILVLWKLTIHCLALMFLIYVPKNWTFSCFFFLPLRNKNGKHQLQPLDSNYKILFTHGVYSFQLIKKMALYLF